MVELGLESKLADPRPLCPITGQPASLPGEMEVFCGTSLRWCCCLGASLSGAGVWVVVGGDRILKGLLPQLTV